MTAARSHPPLTVGADGLRRVPASTPRHQATRDEMAAPRARAPQRWLTVEEVAAEMRVSRMTIYRLVHAYELEAHRVGRSIRILEDSFAAYLARGDDE